MSGKNAEFCPKILFLLVVDVVVASVVRGALSGQYIVLRRGAVKVSMSPNLTGPLLLQPVSPFLQLLLHLGSPPTCFRLPISVWIFGRRFRVDRPAP